MACHDADGNEIDCGDSGSGDEGAPPPDDNSGGDTTQGAPPEDTPSGSSIDPGVDPSAGTAPPSFGGGDSGGGDFGGVSAPSPTPSFSPSPVDTGSLASGPQPGTPGGPQAPSAPTPANPYPKTAQDILKYPDYSGVYQKQLAANAAAQQALLQFEQAKWQQEFGLQQQQFGLQQSQFENSKQQWQKEFDLKTTIANADNAYKQALINTQNVQLAQQAMRDSMTRDFQNQELAFRNQQMAQTSDIEREKLDIQRRLLPVTRTARRAATVSTI